MPSLLKLADIVILPSKSETWGLIVNEAFACSTPVLVSDSVGCSKDLVIPHKTGWVFKNNNINDLVKQLGVMNVTEKVTLTDMGANASHLISTNSIINLCKIVFKGIQ